MNIPLRPISPVGCVDGVQFSLSLPSGCLYGLADDYYPRVVYMCAQKLPRLGGPGVRPLPGARIARFAITLAYRPDMLTTGLDATQHVHVPQS